MTRGLIVGVAIVCLAAACAKKESKSGQAAGDSGKAEVATSRGAEGKDADESKGKGDSPAAAKDGPKNPITSPAPGFSQAAGKIGDAFKSIESKVPRLDPMPPALDTQLGFKMTRIKFLGWTEDGRRFALIATHGLDEGELGGRNQIRLRQVHDALTGNVIASFRVERSQDPDVAEDDDLRKAWEEAQPRKAWHEWTAANRLVGAKAYRKSPSGTTKFEAERDGRPPHGSKFVIEPTSRGFETMWSNFSLEPLRGSSRAPRTRITMVGADGERWESISYRSPFKYEHVAEAVDVARNPRVEGQLEAHWSPLADRVVWVMTQKMVDVHPEMRAQDARFYVRAVGPQIKILDAGVGDEASRKAAEILAYKGLTPTVLETADEPSPVSKIYYRGDAGAKVAEQVAKHVPGNLPSEPLEKAGWIDIIVVLGP